MLDGTVTRLEGLVLGELFVAYTAYLLRTGGVPPEAKPPSGTTPPSEAAETADSTPAVDDAGSTPAIPTALTERVAFPGRDLVFVIAGLAIVLVSGEFLVGAATNLARGAGVSEWVIGGTVVAAGTSTPEFAVSLVAMRTDRIGVSVGNVVGSNVFNIMGILGLTAVLRPLAVRPAALETTAWLLGISVAMVAALWTGRQLSRPEGGLFALSEVGRWVFGLLG